MPTMTDEEFLGAPQQEQPAADQSKKYLSDQDFLGNVEAAPELSYADQAKNKVASFMTGVGKGVPFGQDIPAAIGATLSSAGLMHGSKTIPEQGTWGERFDAAKRAQQEAYERTSKENPYTSGLGTVTGAVGSSVPIARVAAPLEAAVTTFGRTKLAKPLYELAEKGVANKVPLSSIPKLAGTVAEKGTKYGALAGTGAATSGMYGLGEGVTLDERLKNAAREAKTGAIASPLMTAAVPAAAKTLGLVTSGAEKAAERLNASLPASVSTQNPLFKILSRAYEVSPYVGDIMKKGIESGKQRLGESIFGNLKYNTGNLAQKGLEPSIVGQDVKSSLADWIATGSRVEEGLPYQTLEKRISYGTKAPLSNTLNEFNTLMREWSHNVDPAYASSVMTPFKKVLSSALKDSMPGNLGRNYESTKQLRTQIGRLIEDSVLNKDINTATADRLYGALTNDLENVVDRAGRAAGYRSAKADWMKANADSEKIRALRKDLVGVVGDIKSSHNLGIQGGRTERGVYENLKASALGKGRTNLGLLQKVKDQLHTPAPGATAAPVQDWENLVSRISQDIGHDPRTDAFSTKKFVDTYNAMESGAKDILYGPVGSPQRNVMDDVFKVAQEYESHGEGKKFNRYSMWAATALGIGLPGAAAFGAIPTAATAIAGAVASVPIAHMLSNPRAMTNWALLMDRIKNLPPNQAESMLRAASKNASLRKVNMMQEEAEKRRTRRASGGAIGNRNYPAKRLNKIERALKKAQDAIALETKSLMKIPDAQIAQALDIAKDK